MEHCLVL